MTSNPVIKAEKQPQYSAPAVDKALDVIELLASQVNGLSLAEIAAEMNRTMSEIYRVALALSSRGVIAQDSLSERYFLTGKLFELSHRYPPTERLLSLAIPLMQALAERMEQSCHLAVLDREAVLIVASVASPLPMSYGVRVGARFPALETSSGVVLVAYQPAEQWAQWIAAVPDMAAERLRGRLSHASVNAGEEMPSPMVQGVTNLSFAIRDHRGIAMAALTVPFLSQAGLHVDLPSARAMAQQTAAKLAAVLGFTQPDEAAA